MRHTWYTHMKPACNMYLCILYLMYAMPVIMRFAASCHGNPHSDSGHCWGGRKRWLHMWLLLCSSSPDTNKVVAWWNIPQSGSLGLGNTCPNCSDIAGTLGFAKYCLSYPYRICPRLEFCGLIAFWIYMDLSLCLPKSIHFVLKDSSGNYLNKSWKSYHHQDCRPSSRQILKAWDGQ